MEINQAAPKFQDVSIAPMHTVEHILNATMVKTFGCPRSRNAHIANYRKTQVKHYGSSASEAMMSVHVSDYM